MIKFNLKGVKDQLNGPKMFLDNLFVIKVFGVGRLRVNITNEKRSSCNVTIVLTVGPRSRDRFTFDEESGEIGLMTRSHVESYSYLIQTMMIVKFRSSPIYGTFHIYRLDSELGILRNIVLIEQGIFQKKIREGSRSKYLNLVLL